MLRSPVTPKIMTEQVTIRVRPGEVIRFPGRCVACGRPGRDRLRLTKRRGQVTLRVDAPRCAECARALSRRSGREEQLLRLGWFATIVAGLLAASLVFVALSGDWLWRTIAGAAAGIAFGLLVHWIAIRRAASAELPEKRAVREAARIVDFDWRDMTLAFVESAFAGEVRSLNALPCETGPEATDERFIVDNRENGTATEPAPVE